MAAVVVEVGAIVDGVVTGLAQFGAFVELPNGKTGLVHISEVADAYVRQVSDFLSEGMAVRVKVLSFDERGRYALSIKQASPEFRPARPRRSRVDLDDKISRFMKDSDEKLTSLRKATDSKRGGRGGRRF